MEDQQCAKREYLFTLPTTYNKYIFRSRLEARWAVFFDVLGIKWEYEKEGFDLGGYWYLPDFWLPQVKMWAEVKPNEFTDIEREKAFRLSKLTQRPVLMLVDSPEDKPYFAINADTQCPICCYCLTNCRNYPEEEGRFYSQPGGPDDSHWEDTAAAAESAKRYRFEYKNLKK